LGTIVPLLKYKQEPFVKHIYAPHEGLSVVAGYVIFSLNYVVTSPFDLIIQTNQVMIFNDFKHVHSPAFDTKILFNLEVTLTLIFDLLIPKAIWASTDPR